MNLNWHGVTADGQGYSGTGGEYCVALDRAGLDVRMMTPSTKKEKVIIYGNASEPMQKLLRKPYVRGDFGVAHGLPHTFSDLHKIDYKYKIGFTMFETTKIPEAEIWGGKGGAVANINKLDMLWTPSQFCKELFEKEGITIPIRVIHNGINTERYPLMDREPRKVFTFLMLGTLTERKNPGAAIAAFLSLFKDNPDVRLILKTQSGTLGHLTFPYKNLTIVDRLSTHEEVLSYYYDADCFVFPTRGEGFGVPPIEAMATGIPAIIPTHTGLAEYASEDYCYLIDNGPTIKATRFPKKWGDVGEYWDPSYEELKAQMWHIYTHQDEAREKGRKAADFIRKNFNYEKIAGDIIKTLKELEDDQSGKGSKQHRRSSAVR